MSHLLERLYISLARKLPVWMHIAFCIVGFLSLTLLIWLILIYGYMQPSFFNVRPTSTMNRLPQTVFIACFLDLNTAGTCCTCLISLPLNFPAGVRSLNNLDHHFAQRSCLHQSLVFRGHYQNTSCATGLFIHPSLPLLTDTFLLPDMHLGSDHSIEASLLPISGCYYHYHLYA
jgi:hypothetical protein